MSNDLVNKSLNNYSVILSRKNWPQMSTSKR